MRILHRILFRTILCIATLFMACSVRADPAITLNSPQELQVIQRSDSNQANVFISGKVAEVADVIEVKVALVEGYKYGDEVAWTTVAKAREINKGQFLGSISLKAGGWYTITVRARKDKAIVGETTVNKVGVGDVFITAGQSNSANFGKPRQSSQDERVVYFNGASFVPAKDPIPGGCGRGGSVWPILGDLIAQSQEVPVCFRSASLTWTEVKNWMPGVKYKRLMLYDNLVQCVAEFPEGGVRAILWHQGESDSLAKTPASTYYKRLKLIIESVNKKAGYKIPWFVSQASFHPQSNESDEKQVALGQQLLWERGQAKQGPNTDKLGHDYRSDKVHFNQKGLTTYGQMWFEALAAEYDWETLKKQDE